MMDDGINLPSSDGALRLAGKHKILNHLMDLRAASAKPKHIPRMLKPATALKTAL